MIDTTITSNDLIELAEWWTVPPNKLIAPTVLLNIKANQHMFDTYGGYQYYMIHLPTSTPDEDNYRLNAIAYLCLLEAELIKDQNNELDSTSKI